MLSLFRGFNRTLYADESRDADCSPLPVRPGVSWTRIVTRGGRAMTGGAAPIAEIMGAGCGGGACGVEPIKAALVTLLLSAATLAIPQKTSNELRGRILGFHLWSAEKG